MYGLYSRAASNQERPMMERVRYLEIGLLLTKQLQNTKFQFSTNHVRDMKKSRLTEIWRFSNQNKPKKL